MTDRLAHALHSAAFRAPIRARSNPEPSLVRHDGDTVLLSYRHTTSDAFTAELRRELNNIGLELVQPSTDPALAQTFHASLLFSPCTCTHTDPFLVEVGADSVVLSAAHRPGCALLANLRVHGLDVLQPEPEPAVPAERPGKPVKLTENQRAAVRVRASTALRIKTALEIGEIDEDNLRRWAQELEGGDLPGKVVKGLADVRAEVDRLAASLRDWDIRDARSRSEYVLELLETLLTGVGVAPYEPLEGVAA